MATTEADQASSIDTATPRLGQNISRTKAVPWYQPKVGSSLTPAGRQLLETYSGIPASEVEDHIYKIRDAAWEIFPWPCVGEFWFISLGLSLHPRYQDLLARLRAKGASTKLLDLGTCLGQDLRKLIADGAPSEALWGSDYFEEYEAAGHDFFRDADRFHHRFLAADLYDESQESALQKTAGTWDVINIIMFLHIYDWDAQVRACKRILKLLSPEKGSMVIGAQSATTEPGEIRLKPPMVAEGEEKTLYRHSLETFTRMWEEVGKDQGVKLDIWVAYDDEADWKLRVEEEKARGRDRFFAGPTQRRLFFTVTVL
ncbi:MAG: hypothetical protein LQ349_002514 [Xanthoria aureola]|nr:MAG: hypothetical protein LQ349_002514 [Xanthoria aureola]